MHMQDKCILLAVLHQGVQASPSKDGQATQLRAGLSFILLMSLAGGRCHFPILNTTSVQQNHREDAREHGGREWAKLSKET